MSAATLEFKENGSSAMYWLVLAYLFHTLGELCTSPTAMALITKLAPVKYASFMMGAYFASTGFGNWQLHLVNGHKLLVNLKYLLEYLLHVLYSEYLLS